MVQLGRPSKYKKEYLETVAKYLLTTEDGNENSRDVNMVSVEGLAKLIGVNKTTLYKWEKAQPEFSNALDDIRLEQYERLVNGGLSGKYNSAITKLMLSSNHGMSEKNALVTEDKDGNQKELSVTTINIIKPSSDGKDN